VAFVVSEGQIQNLFRPTPPPNYSLRIADDYTRDYAQIWRTQPSVRTCVSFLARNVASLGLHAFERVSDTDRVRLADHPAALLLDRPSPTTTRYRLIDRLVHDLGIYDTAYWLKLKRSDGGLALLRLNPKSVTPMGETGLEPSYYRLRGSKGYKDIQPDQLVHFRGYDPDGEFGAPPIEALRQILAEEWEAGRMRSNTLRNGARISGYIERPENKPWSEAAREKFRKGWQSQYTGGGPQVGGTPILEDGMTFKQAAQTAEQLQYVEVRKLTREETASAYFIPPPMVGLLDHATFGNIEEQHKMLYQDTLGPWLSMIEQELKLQLLPDLPDSGRVYVEFNLAEKLRGSFEEQAQAASTATGAPWMTRNEQRARFNLPRLEGGDELVTPLNVLVGGQASPRDSAPKAAGVRTKDRPPATYTEQTERVLAGFFKRQRAAVLSALGAKAPDWWDTDRWDRELADDLVKIAHLIADKIGPETAGRLGFDPDEYDVARTEAFLREVAKSRAGAINATTLDQLEKAIADEDGDPAVVFDNAETGRTSIAATTLVTTFAAFATAEAAWQLAPQQATKTWVVASGNPRPSHARMDGETVGIDETFSNGMNWPGDPAGGVDEVAGCTCGVDVSVQ
jgi:HK97 family phage portal protein